MIFTWKSNTQRWVFYGCSHELNKMSIFSIACNSITTSLGLVTTNNLINSSKDCRNKMATLFLELSSARHYKNKHTSFLTETGLLTKCMYLHKIVHELKKSRTNMIKQKIRVSLSDKLCRHYLYHRLTKITFSSLLNKMFLWLKNIVWIIMGLYIIGIWFNRDRILFNLPLGSIRIKKRRFIILIKVTWRLVKRTKSILF